MQTRLAVGLAAILILIGSALLVGGASTPAFTVHDKAYYASPDQVSFVRPGLTLKILSGEIGADGKIRARFRITDPKGLPLDREGIVTPGAVAVSFVAAYIPKDQRQYSSYTMRDFTNSGKLVTDPWTDAGGTFEKTGEGEYVYTFATKAPAGMDRSVTHTIGGQASRNLTEFDLGTQADNDVYHFVPDGSPVTVVRDVVKTATCNNRCHDPLAIHGGNRRKVEYCILCHQPQALDIFGNGTADFPVMIHKIHRGSDLPSVKTGTPYKVANNDFSDVVFPAGVRNCEVCHDPNSGAAQASAWLKPNRAACGACHDDVNFATGEGHLDLPQVSDSLCSNCHIQQGELEFDASIRGAHLDSRFSTALPGTTFDILSVEDGVAGKRPTVTFSIKDKSGKAILPSEMNRVALILAGPTSKDYASFVSEDGTKAQGSADGTYRFTLQTQIPADAKGTYSIGIEGYRNITLLPGTKKERTVRDAGMNKVLYFSVDGSKVAPRRTVVAIDRCNACHLKLEMHGGNRNRIEHCVQCHNPNQTDEAQRPKTEFPPQTVNFRTMVHRIHTGEDLEIEYTIYGFGGRPIDFKEVIFPGDRRNCAKCHVNNSYQVPPPDSLRETVNPRGLVNPMGPATSACLGCHTGTAVAAHAIAMTTPIGESCDVCHGQGMEFSVDRVHAR